VGVVILEPYVRSQKQTNWELRAMAAKQPIGIAYVLMLPGRQYAVGVVGETRITPLFTRGAVALLDDELSILIHSPKR
jgi:hypothetical protein